MKLSKKAVICLSALAVCGCSGLDEMKDCENERPAAPLVETQVRPDFSIVAEFDIPSQSQPWEDGGKYRIEVWDCIDLAWWTPVEPQKVVQVFEDQTECETYERVFIEYHECYTAEGFDYHYRDQDGDGFSAYDGDCDESDPTIGDDRNGDGVSDCVDQDVDGFTPENGDCADEDPSIVGIDQDADATSDCVDDDGDGFTELEGDCDDEDATNLPEDLDQDGTFDCADDDGDGLAEIDGDCNDLAWDVFPGAGEICDGCDNNCNGLIDESRDQDGDGFAGCPDDTGRPDCDDGDAQIFPDAEEVCNLTDDDCNGAIDDGVTDIGDELEPNDLWFAPQQLGTLDVTPLDLNGAVTSEDDEDWYGFQIRDDGEDPGDSPALEIWLDQLPPDANYDLFLYTVEHSQPVLLMSSTHLGSATEHITLTNETAREHSGGYLLKVAWKEGYTGCWLYHLSISAFGSPGGSI